MAEIEKNENLSTENQNENKIEENVLNLDTLSIEELTSLLENTVKQDDINSVKSKVGAIKIAFQKIIKEEKQHIFDMFISDGGKAEEFVLVENPLEERFNKAFSIYRERKYKFDEEQEQIKQENLKLKVQIIEELKVLIDSEEELKKTYDAFKSIQERWKNVGQVPQADRNNLWQNYHFLVEKFFDKVKINNELKDLDLKKNLEAKVDLCEKAEELLVEPSIVEAFKKLQRLHELWREIGPIPQDKKEEVWERFRIATEKINLRRKDHINGLQNERQSNYDSKLALCQKVEAFNEIHPKTIKEWQEASDQIVEIQKVWRTIGFAPKKNNNEIWAKFKTAVDNFYAAKKEFISKIKDEQNENYNLKVNLCIQAEALKDSSEWKKTADELIRLQQEWKKVGPVPSKYSDKVWKRFRAACDEFFNRKGEFFKNIDSIEAENLVKKEDLIKRVQEFVLGEDNNENIEILKGFQREWVSIGHISIKLKDKVQKEFRKAIDAHFDKLKLSNMEKSALNYKDKIDNMLNSDNAGGAIAKEKNNILKRINEIKSEVKLWENNLGFFANSKKADVLKIEFEKKINKAKADIMLLEEKLKILKQQ